MVFDPHKQPKFDKSEVRKRDLGAVMTALWELRERHGVDVLASGWIVSEEFGWNAVLSTTIDGTDYRVRVSRSKPWLKECSHGIYFYEENDSINTGYITYPLRQT